MTNPTPANHLDVSGHGIALTVDSHGIDGKPIVSLTVDGADVDGAQARTTPFGLEVEALVQATPDAHQVYLRATLPQVRVTDGPVSFAGVALVTRVRQSIAPQLLDGVLSTYELRPLTGTAAAVESLTGRAAD